LIAFNFTRHLVLARDLRLANNFFERIWRLRGSFPLKEGEGFLIPSCHGIHTFGINYPIDVLYLNGNGEVLGMDEELPPNSLGAFRFRTCLVLELPAGTIRWSETKPGDVLGIEGGGDTNIMEPLRVSFSMPTLTRG